MINLILTLSLSLVNAHQAAVPAAAVAQFRPCVWPNVCKTQTPAPVIAQFTTCVFPRKCGKSA